MIKIKKRLVRISVCAIFCLVIFCKKDRDLIAYLGKPLSHVEFVNVSKAEFFVDQVHYVLIKKGDGIYLNGEKLSVTKANVRISPYSVFKDKQGLIMETQGFMCSDDMSDFNVTMTPYGYRLKRDGLMTLYHIDFFTPISGVALKMPSWLVIKIEQNPYTVMALEFIELSDEESRYPYAITFVSITCEAFYYAN